MFKSISWQEFLTIALWAHFGYYLVVVLAFYGRDLVSKFRSAPSTDVPQAGDIRSGSTPMGSIQPDRLPVKRTVTAEDVNISSSINEAEYHAEQLENLFLDRVLSDLLNEIKIVAGVCSQEQHSRDQSLSMVTDLLLNYAGVDESRRPVINRYINEQFSARCSFVFTEQELMNAWPKE